MKGWKRALSVLVLFLVWGSLVLAVENITLRAYVIGPGPMGIKKATNLELAAQRLNQMLEAIGSEIRVQVDVNFSELK